MIEDANHLQASPAPARGQREDIAIVGAGVAGGLAALDLADRGHKVVLLDRAAQPLSAASFVNEGKIHLGFVYAADPTGRTARQMIQGALAFRSIVSRWVETSVFDTLITPGFDYLVPSGSQLSVLQIERHFALVNSEIRAQLASTGADYLGAKDLPLPARLRAHPYGSNGHEVLAAFSTSERAIDTHGLASELRSAILGHPNIDFRSHHTVSRIVRAATGWLVETDQGTDGPFGAVLNAAWEGRRELDHRSGFADNDDWFLRYKAAAVLADPFQDLSNVTLLLGSYGDVVRYNCGRLYLSWYPSMMMASTRDLTLRAPELSTDGKRDLVRVSLEALANWYPALRRYLAVPGLDTTSFMGGFITARGSTDIDDRNSRLHERSAFGLHALGDRYFSLDPGKYTTGPLFALKSAEAIARPASVHAVVTQ